MPPFLWHHFCRSSSAGSGLENVKGQWLISEAHKEHQDMWKTLYKTKQLGDKLYRYKSNIHIHKWLSNHSVCSAKICSITATPRGHENRGDRVGYPSHSDSSVYSVSVGLWYAAIQSSMWCPKTHSSQPPHEGRVSAHLLSDSTWSTDLNLLSHLNSPSKIFSVLLKRGGYWSGRK